MAVEADPLFLRGPNDATENPLGGAGSPGTTGGGDGGKGGSALRGLAVKALLVAGGAFLLKTAISRTRRADHVATVANSFSGVKSSEEQAKQDPLNYFNIRVSTCPAMDMADGTKVLYSEQAFWRSPDHPFRQRFYLVKPGSKDPKSDAELASYAVGDVEKYRNFCERSGDKGAKVEEIPGDVGEHLSSVYMSRCERGKKCLYEGATKPGGFPQNWNGAVRCTSEVTLFRNGEIHQWDRGWDKEEKQVWGPKQGPYEFKPASSSSAPFNPPARTSPSSSRGLITASESGASSSRPSSSSSSALLPPSASKRGPSAPSPNPPSPATPATQKAAASS
eukprot:TRINITY_DN7694_c0_g5_i1.p1 TRINITY_DN7694_c0_g5~~TRINITY_DN7694_c0_g5_i1.p1  ORF type:complete len:335 (+),score=69.25 TRINITY_DN7694_c0_g5_i1:141-1145(+)